MGNQRECGVLLPISSLPSKYGIGCFSKSAYEFVDQLKAAGQGCWQILPLGPTSYGDSPYQSFSTFAGNPYFISLEDLIEEGVLTEKECDAVDFGSREDDVDYEKIYKGRLQNRFLRIRSDDLHQQLERAASCHGIYFRSYEKDTAGYTDLFRWALRNQLCADVCCDHYRNRTYRCCLLTVQ